MSLPKIIEKLKYECSAHGELLSFGGFKEGHWNSIPPAPHETRTGGIVEFRNRLTCQCENGFFLSVANARVLREKIREGQDHSNYPRCYDALDEALEILGAEE